MLAGTGMRWGEAVALEVRDVDLDDATVRVTKAEKSDPDNPGQTIIGPTKTAKSRRTITLPSELVNALTPLVEGRKGTARLFVTPDDRPVKHRNFYDLWLHTILPAAEVERVRVHDLRHSHAAWLIAEGIPLRVIQARLGHEKITTTIDTYGHLLPDLQRAAAEAAQNVFKAIELPSVERKSLQV
jgi:integrase